MGTGNICDCGRKTNKVGNDLYKGDIQSCSLNCRLRSLTPINRWLNEYKRGAKVRKLSWSLTNNHFYSIVKSRCHYCGALPVIRVSAQRSFQDNEPLQGIDRKDSKSGYSLNNCVPCCTECNYAKRGVLYKDFVG